MRRKDWPWALPQRRSKPHRIRTWSWPASAPTPTYQDKFVTVNGLKIHYLDWGGNSKPPLVLIHGIARHAHTFDHLIPELSRNYHGIAYDMRGHGDSGWSAEGADLGEDHVKDLEGLVQQLRLKNITLHGNSTGGRVVQVFAGLHPDLVSRIVVEDAPSLWIYNTKWFGPYSKKLQGIEFCPIGNAQEMRTAYYE